MANCRRCGRVHEQNNSHQLFKCSECDSILCANQVIRSHRKFGHPEDYKWIHQCFVIKRWHREEAGRYQQAGRTFTCGPVEPVWRNIAGGLRTGVVCFRCNGTGTEVTMVDEDYGAEFGTCERCRGLGFTCPAVEAARIFRESPAESVFIAHSQGG